MLPERVFVGLVTSIHLSLPSKKMVELPVAAIALRFMLFASSPLDPGVKRE